MILPKSGDKSKCENRFNQTITENDYHLLSEKLDSSFGRQLELKTVILDENLVETQNGMETVTKHRKV